jgi:16S rRNA processing protein RimM
MFDWVVGVVVRPFGIRGEMKTRLVSEVADITAGRTVLLVKPDGTAQQATVAGIRLHQGHALLRFDGIETMSEAELWRGAEVRMSRPASAPLLDDTYYTADLIGMTVRRKDGTTVGSVENVLHYPAQDLLVVGEALIPAVKAIVVRVDTESRTITIDPPDGLLPEA